MSWKRPNKDHLSPDPAQDNPKNSTRPRGDRRFRRTQVLAFILLYRSLWTAAFRANPPAGSKEDSLVTLQIRITSKMLRMKEVSVSTPFTQVEKYLCLFYAFNQIADVSADRHSSFREPLSTEVLPILLVQIMAHETRLVKGRRVTTRPLSSSAWLILVIWFAESSLKLFIQSSQETKELP
ncbi:hypothetical protein DUI87_04488 [Hirundo rustica rustica]|uniref:Uncharacterized protein n=1 Tax=Hirundo rustica rustica TaxID=333673 RepID=A0A3M0L3Z2_HIRRU|nr:hypothetical protein DUI87_04488 [Hirundo rustica rustica]